MPNAFRWDIVRREQLGRLLTGEPVPRFAAVLDEVRRCAAHVLAMAGQSRVIFIGRSPENLYDYLTGAFSETSVATRLALLNVSLRGLRERWPAMSAETTAAMREQFAAVGLEPAAIVRRARRVTLVDVICSGETFGTLLALLDAWAAEQTVDARSMRRRLRVVGIVTRGATSYTTTRWKRLDWARTLQPSAVKGVSVPEWFWSHLGDFPGKVSRSNPPSAWGDPEMAKPPRDEKHAEGVRLARALYEAGRSRTERDALASALTGLPAIRHVWCRMLAAELRAASRPRRVERCFASKRRVRSGRRHVGHRSGMRT